MSKRTFAERMRDKKMNKQNGNDGIPMTCPKCGYHWHYGGEMMMATCPSCALKIAVAENREDTV